MFGKLFGGKKNPRDAIKKAFVRRPLVAYPIALYECSGGPRYCVYTDAYGLEMTIDNEYPIDTVLFTQPELVHVITKETGATTMGTVYAGALAAPPDGAFRSLTEHSAKWFFIDVTAQNAAQAISQISAASSAGLNILARVSNTSLIEKLPANLKTELAVAISKGDDAAMTQRRAAEARKSLGPQRGASTRILIAGKLEEAKALELLLQPDIDGVYIEDGRFEKVVTILTALVGFMK